MSDDSIFVDTNVLIYGRDSSEPEKQERAAAWLKELWRQRRGKLSVQVLQEFYVTVTQKLDPGMTKSAARADVRDLMAWRPILADASLLESAWRIQDRYRQSWWDSLIVAAAQTTECKYLLTEDLQHGMCFGDLEVVSPFEVAPGSI